MDSERHQMTFHWKKTNSFKQITCISHILTLIRSLLLSNTQSFYFVFFYFIKTRHKGRDTTQHVSITVGPYCIDMFNFSEGGKPEYPEKNQQSTGKINYGNLIQMKYHTRLGFQWREAQRGNRLRHPCFGISCPLVHVEQCPLLRDLKIMSRTWRKTQFCSTTLLLLLAVSKVVKYTLSRNSLNKFTVLFLGRKATTLKSKVFPHDWDHACIVTRR